jgi:serine/threonine protein kinase
MQYPLISEYLAAIQDAHENLDKLNHLVPVLDKHGEPYRSSGAFAVVFKMKDEQTGKCYALKCFTEDQEGRAEAYRQIAEELEFVDSSYITSVKYLEKELFVDSNCEDDEFPVLLMDWIEGETMETYIAENYTDSYEMSMLCYRFCKMAAWLRSQSFAHGDIKPDNIMVRPDGTLTLVDYDGMFVPAMKGQKSLTIGTKDFSHPLRTMDDFDETIDDFSLASIALSLKAISLDSSLLQSYGASDRLLFSATDYLDLSKSKIFTALQSLLADVEARTLLSMFLLASAQKDLSMCSFRLFGLQKPKEKEVWSTEVTEEDLKNAVEDEYGVKYSKDWKRLLKAPRNLDGVYSIRIGVKVIANKAFCFCESLVNINIPKGITSIGNGAFDECKSLKSINIPDSVTSIGDLAFTGCDFLTSINISDSVTNIGYSAFSECKSLKSINIPDSVTRIRNYAFFECDSLTSINIPDSVTYIGHCAFSECKSLKSINIPDSVIGIGDFAFSECDSLTSINIPDSVIDIGDFAFSECKSLKSINIPDSVTSIGDRAFEGCDSLTSINIPDSVTSIVYGAFSACI